MPPQDANPTPSFGGFGLSLNPDCGFAPGIAADIPLDEAYLKLKNEAEAARRLREKYG